MIVLVDRIVRINRKFNLISQRVDTYVIVNSKFSFLLGSNVVNMPKSKFLRRKRRATVSVH